MQTYDKNNQTKKYNYIYTLHNLIVNNRYIDVYSHIENLAVILVKV